MSPAPNRFGVDTTPDDSSFAPPPNQVRTDKQIIAGRIRAAVDAGDYALVNQLMATVSRPAPPGPTDYTEEEYRSRFGTAEWKSVANRGGLPLRVELHEGRGGITYWVLRLAPGETVMLPAALAAGLQVRDPSTGLVIGGLAPTVTIDDVEPVLADALTSDGALGPAAPRRGAK